MAQFIVQKKVLKKCIRHRNGAMVLFFFRKGVQNVQSIPPLATLDDCSELLATTNYSESQLGWQVNKTPRKTDHEHVRLVRLIQNHYPPPNEPKDSVDWIPFAYG